MMRNKRREDGARSDDQPSHHPKKKFFLRGFKFPIEPKKFFLIIGVQRCVLGLINEAYKVADIAAKGQGDFILISTLADRLLTYIVDISNCGIFIKEIERGDAIDLAHLL